MTEMSPMKYSRIPHRLIFSAIAFLTCFFVACNTSPQQPLKIGLTSWTGYEPLYLARDLGYFNDAPLEIIEYSGIAEMRRAFDNGEIHVLSSTLDSALLRAERNNDLRLWLLLDTSNGGDALVGQSEVKSIQDLKDRTVGLTPEALSLLVFTRALQSVDLPLDAVKQVSLDGIEPETAFEDKEIDAIITYDPLLSKLLQQGANLLFDTRQMPGEVVDVLLSYQETQDKFPQKLQTLAEGWFKALQYIQKNPDDAVQRMADRQGISQEEFTQSLKGLRLMDLEKNKVLLSGQDMELHEGAKRLTTFLIEQESLKQKVDLDNLFDDRFVKVIEQS
ncbi:ABC transporter substrate-binding protein [Spirulina sp. 06S082]|uniref:ABC transporter substrate-binding protein n=1 Tax=Spirulina sp. 06S082 TaxID=3110248 RepID=UPI002B1EC573|nr:ABC transporter substrate-binding protein [Spirulina sp. 06S082]MEA5469487.1 ABC transporter substrate-binding protein [Spirulina sp. 06S082]